MASYWKAGESGPWIITDDDGREITVPKGSSQADVDAAMIAFLGPRPPPRWLIPKSVLLGRVIFAGKIDAAMEMLRANNALYAMWFSSDWPNVYNDDPDVIRMLKALGIDLEAALARP